MIRYFPIPNEPDFDCSLSDMVRMEWVHQVIRADFLLPESIYLFRVRFDHAEIVRVLDEMPLSTEEPQKNGLVPRHFAYRVEGSIFRQSQSSVLEDIYPKLAHYRFVTGWTCLDVLSVDPPIFEIIP